MLRAERSASVGWRDRIRWPRWPSCLAWQKPARRPRDALGRAHRHRANLRGWPANAAEAALRAARASSVLDGGSLQLSDGGTADPVLAGALRVSEALEGGATSLVGVWQRAPLQAIARLHALAAADIADDDRLGRPRGDADVGRRLELLADIVTGGTYGPTRSRGVSAPVLAAVVHGELLTLAPFGTADGVVARAVSRLVTIAERPGPTRARRAGGVLDAPFRRLPRRGARFLVRYGRRPYGLGTAELSCAARRRAGGAVDRAGRIRPAAPGPTRKPGQREAGDAPN